MREIKNKTSRFKMIYRCDMDGCDGEVVFSEGTMLLSNPPKYKHKCQKCGESYTLEGIYPTIKDVEETDFEREILFAKLQEDAVIPSKRDEDGAYDVYARFEDESVIIQPHETKMFSTGIISAFDKKWRGILKERGSNGVLGISQRAGVFDSGFRNEWKVPVTNLNTKPVLFTKITDESELQALSNDYIIYPYKKAICQVLFEEVPVLNVKEVTIEEVMSITSERGTGMVGSSGK